jgi:hypothetical protein
MAQFKTAYLQRAVPFDVNVVGTVSADPVTSANRGAAIMRGDLVKLTPKAYAGTPSEVHAYITKASADDVTNKTATHIVALTDMTLDGHVPVEYKDYRPSDLVAADMSSAPTSATTTKTKKVALYPIWDWNDIVLDADGHDING